MKKTKKKVKGHKFVTLSIIAPGDGECSMLLIKDEADTVIQRFQDEEFMDKPVVSVTMYVQTCILPEQKYVVKPAGTAYINLANVAVMSVTPDEDSEIVENDQKD